VAGRFAKWLLNRQSTVQIGRGYSPTEDTYGLASGIGQSGGICECPSGQRFEVGDNGDGCGSLACVGGTAVSNCSDTGIATANWHKKVVCATTDPATGKRYAGALADRDVEKPTGYSFRNPPSFMPFVGESSNSRGGQGPYTAGATWLAPTAEFEKEALLDHLLEHENTPPFVALHLIKRFVSSNPSPRYIKVVADAFKTGTYNGECRLRCWLCWWR
jgi:hypothetical protein